MRRDTRAYSHRLRAILAGIAVMLFGLGNPLAALAAGWSPSLTISANMPTSTPNAFAGNSSGNQLWVTATAVTGGVVVQSAQRSFGGSWSSLTSISAVLPSAPSLSAALSTNDSAAVAWSSAAGLQIALRSPSGVWQAPVSFNLTGSLLNLQVKLDAQGRGVAVWTRLTATVAVVEAVTWSAGGSFDPVVQLSSSAHGSFLPDVAINEAGTVVVVWQAAGLLDNSNPYQIEATTRPAGGSWSAVTAVSPSVSQTWTPRVALDGTDRATVVWEQGATVNNYRIYAASRVSGGGWSSATRIEPSDWYFAGQDSIATDAAGNVTAAWLVEDTSGALSVRSATRSAAGVWGTATTLGPCSTQAGLCSTPQVAASADGSITVVGWAAYGSGNAPNVAVRLGMGAWVRTVLSSNNARLVSVLAANNAHASAFWPEPSGVRHRVVIKQSDYQ